MFFPMTQSFMNLSAALLLLAGGAATLGAQIPQNSLHADERINGKLVWEAFEPQRQVLQTSSAVIYTDGKSRLKTIYGTVVSAEGHVLTKASEIAGKSPVTLRIGRERFEDVELLGVDDQWDVALLKVNSDKQFTPVELSGSKDVPQGHWVVSNGSTTRTQRRVRVGIVSATTREIGSLTSKVILGIQLGSEKNEELLIKKVTGESGAAKAGLKDGDTLLSAGGAVLKKRTDLLEALKGKKPGDVLPVEILRKGRKMKFDVELMPRPEGPQRMSRNDQMSGGELSLSKRRDGFPRVIHHDTPLTKSSVGGPLLTLDGKCVGMNIARASRVATFAIPAAELRGIFEDLRAK